MEKSSIKNRKGQNIVVLLEKSDNQKGLAFVMHGLSGNKEQPHIATFAQAFKEKGYTVVRFDTTNTFGESDGKYEDATVTSYFQDLEDVISWAKTQDWYQEPFYLAGHSLGGISVILYAQNHPHEAKGLAPISSLVSGKLSLTLHKNKDTAGEWKRTGWKEEMSSSVPGRLKRLPWTHMEDRLKYDVLLEADKLTMPVLLIVGENDDRTPPEHQQMLYDKLPGAKEIHIIKDAPHTFVEQIQLEEIREIFRKWIDKPPNYSHLYTIEEQISKIFLKV